MSVSALLDTLLRQNWPRIWCIWQRDELCKGPASFVHTGQFILLEQLGEGTYGTCHHVSDCFTPDAHYALKQLKSHRLHDWLVLKRFKTEMKALQAIHDKNIIGIARMRIGSEPWLAMEYAGGDSLKKWAGHGQMDISLACEICLQIARGLKAALGQGIVHRDIAPANVLIVPAVNQGVLVKLLDFGVARFVRDVGLQDTFGPLGHAAYMSLRSLENAHDADTSDDLFSLGCIFFQLLTGKLPYAVGNGLAERARILKTCKPSIKELRLSVPNEVVEIVERLLGLSVERFWQRFWRSPLAPFRTRMPAEPKEIIDRLEAIRRTQPMARYQPPPPNVVVDPPSSSSPDPRAPTVTWQPNS